MGWDEEGKGKRYEGGVTHLGIDSFIRRVFHSSISSSSIFLYFLTTESSLSE